MIIQSKNVYYNETLQPLALIITNGKITKISAYDSEKVDKDYGENWIIPGLIDIHNHGYNGLDANQATIDWVKKWMAYLPKEGVTSTCPAISSAPKKQFMEGMANIAKTVKQGYKGANILGIYSEGPFISAKYKGAQQEENLLIPTKEIIDEMLEVSQGLLKYVMVAPEMLENMDVISYCREKGLKVAIGHSGASFEICSKAKEAGAVSFTHTYNGMSGLHHRQAGVVGAAMYYDDMYAELIGDGVHVSFPACNILAKVKGKDKLISVTDSVSFKGYPCGEYIVNGQKRIVCDDGVARLENGTIAGSANRLNVILGREIKQAGINYVTAINSCTANPATLLGYENSKGFIKENYDADLTVLDNKFNVIQTYINGEEML